LAETVDASKGMESESLPFASIATDDQTVAVAAMAVAAAGEPPSERTTKDTASSSKDTDVDLVSANKEGSEAKEETTETKVETAEKTLEKAAGEKKGDEAAALDSPYPYHVNVGKDVISGKGGKVCRIISEFVPMIPCSCLNIVVTNCFVHRCRFNNTTVTFATSWQSPFLPTMRLRAKLPNAESG
jgi:hypothetical protein